MAYNFGSSPQPKKLNINKFRGVDFATSVAQVSTQRSPNAQNMISDIAGKPVKRTGYKSVNIYKGEIGGEKVSHPSWKVRAVMRLNTVINDVEYEKFLIQIGSYLYVADMSEEHDRYGNVEIETMTYPCFIHATRAVNENNDLVTSSNTNNCKHIQYDGKLYLFDGINFRVFGNFDDEKNDDGSPAWRVKNSSGYNFGKEPTVVLGMKPDGTSGTPYEDVNLLCYRRTYSFFVGEADSETTEFHISANDSIGFYASNSSTSTNERRAKVRVMGEDGEFGDWHIVGDPNDDFATVSNRVIKFKTAPGKSPGAGGGIDNVEISVVPSKSQDGIADITTARGLITKCTIGIAYGLNGAADRLFLSGNNRAKNFIYWSEVGDFSYFPSQNYMYLGQDSAAIMGFSVVNNTLIVHKESNEQYATMFAVTGSYDGQKQQFAISGTIQGEGAIAKGGFARLDTEPLFLSKHGVYAITSQYLTLERYAENRSYYVNPKLIKEPDMDKAVMINHNNYLYLAFPSGNVYVADGRQKVREQYASLSEFQYEWYFLTNVPAIMWFEYDDHLWFGTSDGRICRFYDKDKESDSLYPIYTDEPSWASRQVPISYDEYGNVIASKTQWYITGTTIHAYWDIPYLGFNYISKKKTLKGFWCMTAPEFAHSSIDIMYHYAGRKVDAKQENLTDFKYTTLDQFGFDIMDFGNDRDGHTRFSFILDDSPLVVATNRKAKKFVLIQFRIENKQLNEGFGFHEFEMTYMLGGKNKGA